MDVKGFLGGGKAEKKKTRNADQIRGAKAVGRRWVFCAEKKARRKETKRLSCTYLRFSFLCWPGWPFLVEGVSATEKDERDKKNKSRARHEQQRR